MLFESSLFVSNHLTMLNVLSLLKRWIVLCAIFLKC
jgi:hypothetical protein